MAMVRRTELETLKDELESAIGMVKKMAAALDSRDTKLRSSITGLSLAVRSLDGKHGELLAEEGLADARKQIEALLETGADLSAVVLEGKRYSITAVRDEFGNPGHKIERLK